MTSFVNSHAWHVVLTCLIKMNHSPFKSRNNESLSPAPGVHQTDFSPLEKYQHPETGQLAARQSKGI